MSPEACFRSTFPLEDRAYFEQGVHKYYGLFIHEMNGQLLTSVDYQRVADLIGVRFDYRTERQELEHEPEGPDLCLRTHPAYKVPTPDDVIGIVCRNILKHEQRRYWLTKTGHACSVANA